MHQSASDQELWGPAAHLQGHSCKYWGGRAPSPQGQDAGDYRAPILLEGAKEGHLRVCESVNEYASLEMLLPMIQVLTSGCSATFCLSDLIHMLPAYSHFITHVHLLCLDRGTLGQHYTNSWIQDKYSQEHWLCQLSPYISLVPRLPPFLLVCIQYNAQKQKDLGTNLLNDIRWMQGGCRGKGGRCLTASTCTINWEWVSYQSSEVLAILWTSWVLPSNGVLNDEV